MLLHPEVRRSALDCFEAAENLLTGRAKPRIVQGYRTFYQQQQLYDQGRTKPGKIVTNAKPGSSFHNYGLAIDFCLIIDGKEASWNTEKDFDEDKHADWVEVVAIFENGGWEWGGSWRTFKDLPHLQKTFGYKWQTLLQRRNEGKVDQQGYVLLK